MAFNRHWLWGGVPALAALSWVLIQWGPIAQPSIEPKIASTNSGPRDSVGVPSREDSVASQVLPAAIASVAPRPPLPGHIDFAKVEKSTNFRAFVHEAIANPDREKIALAYRMSGICAVVQHQRSLKEGGYKIPEHLVEKWRKRDAACTASGGVDFQQQRALSAVIRKNYPDLYEIYGKGVTGSAAQQAILDRHVEPRYIMLWGSAAADENSENRSNLVGNESALKELPEYILSSAWTAVVCSIGDCDLLDYRVSACSGEGLCGNPSLEALQLEVVRLRYKITEEQWSEIVAAVRRRAALLFPNALAQPPSH